MRRKHTRKAYKKTRICKCTVCGKVTKTSSHRKKTCSGFCRGQQKRLTRNFKMEASDYQNLVKEQNNRCKICNKEETTIHHSTKTIQSLAVDHCHTTGKIRGLLCQACNTAIGKLKNNIVTLKSAIKYLTEHNAQ